MKLSKHTLKFYVESVLYTNMLHIHADRKFIDLSAGRIGWRMKKNYLRKNISLGAFISKFFMTTLPTSLSTAAKKNRW